MKQIAGRRRWAIRQPLATKNFQAFGLGTDEANACSQPEEAEQLHYKDWRLAVHFDELLDVMVQTSCRCAATSPSK
jgi:hypothetical protein